MLCQISSIATAMEPGMGPAFKLGRRRTRRMSKKSQSPHYFKLISALIASAIFLNACACGPSGLATTVGFPASASAQI